MRGRTVAFYAPLKSPDHDVPSGDRLMARSLIRCIEKSGFEVAIASRLRARIADPYDDVFFSQLEEDAEREILRLSTQWESEGAPSCWFCYHPYYKSPDLIGPALCRKFQVPYITAEASLSKRRADGVWKISQAKVLDAVELADTNVYFTERDRAGLLEFSGDVSVVKLSPFIDVLPRVPERPSSESARQTINSRSSPPNLVSVAMMRSGDKFDSYQFLARSLTLILSLPWVLHVVGDGPLEPDVRALFKDFPADRIVWHGKQNKDQIASIFEQGSVYVWPGCGEAYGLAYLEAQAAGLPVVAFDTAGVSEVVRHGYSGVLVEEGNVKALSNAIESLLTNEKNLVDWTSNAVQHINDNHTFAKAHETVGNILAGVLDETA